MRRIIVGLRLGNRNELGTDCIDLGVSCGGEGNCEQPRIQDAAEKIA